MKVFLQVLFATMIGLFIGFVFVMFSIMGMIGNVTSQPEVKLEPGTVLQIELSGHLQERYTEKISDYINTVTGKSSPRAIGTDEVLEALHRAKKNRYVSGVYLHCGDLKASYSTMREIRQALKNVKESGKFIYAYADNYSQSVYYLASVADSIFLHPQGAVDLRGISVINYFFKDLFDKVGFEMQVFRIGKYKSAVEAYSDTQMSEAAQEQLTSVIHSFWEEYTSEVALARNLSPCYLDKAATDGVMFAEAEKFVEMKLVDKLLYECKISDILKAKAKTSDLRTCTVNEINHTAKTGALPEKKIAIIYAVGTIDGENIYNYDEENCSSDQLCKVIEEVEHDSSYCAAVLRINSPGGSAAGSEKIWRALKDLQKRKPLIASMSDVAASGGYYIATAADSIFAQPYTITGSIGIFTLLPNDEGVREKLGINRKVINTNPSADFGNVMRKVTDREAVLINKELERGYKLFLEHCAESRKKTVAEILPLAGGRVYSGKQAYVFDLIDRVGDIKMAVEAAAKLAGIGTDFQVIDLPKKSTFSEQLLAELHDANLSILPPKLEKAAILLQRAEAFAKGDRMQVALPYSLEIY